LIPLDVVLSRSECWMVECAALIDGVPFPTTNRLRVAITLQHLCIEHHQGIHTLVEQRVIGSAFSLLRPQLESYVRGVWFYHCASDKKILAFLNGDEPPNFGLMIEAIEKIDGFDCGTLSDIKKIAYRNLNDFTHGGSTQVKARNSLDEVVSNYLPEHIVGLVASATSLSLMASVAIAAAVCDNRLANKLLKTYQKIFKEDKEYNSYSEAKSQDYDLRSPQLLDRNHAVVKICGFGEHSFTIEDCQQSRDHLDQAIRLLEYNQYSREIPNTVYCKICNTAGKESCSLGFEGKIWHLPDGWGWVRRHDNVLDCPGEFCACPEHKEFD